MRSIAFFAPYIITQEKIFFNIQRKYLHLLRFCSIIKEIVILSFEQGETIMVSKKFVIENEQGLHMRPAGVLAKAVTKFESDVTIVFEENIIYAK